MLDTMLELDSDAGKSQVMKAMDGHILQYGTLTVNSEHNVWLEF